MGGNLFWMCDPDGGAAGGADWSEIRRESDLTRKGGVLRARSVRSLSSQLQKPPLLLPAEHAGGLQASSAQQLLDFMGLWATATYQDGSHQPCRATEPLPLEMHQKYKIHS